jgi:hypothetical protein
MFFRLTEELPGIEVEEVLTEHLTLNLNEFLEAQTNLDYQNLLSVAECFAMYSEQELLLIIQTRPKSLTAPLSLFISQTVDTLALAIADRSKLLFAMLNLGTQLLIDQVQDLKNLEYSKLWEEVEFEGKTYFIKSSREDVRLTMEANKLLSDQ